MARDPDHDVVRRAARGDEAAFTELVRSHQDRVYSLVRGIVRDPDAAADVTQETFVAVLRHLDTFQQNASFSTWLHRIAMRKAYDHLRKRVPTPVDPVSARVVERTAMFDGHDQQLMRSSLIDAIASLDDGFREALLLVDVLGRSIEEAAATLEVAPGTVKSRLFRARGALASALGTLGYDGASNQ